MLDRTLTTPNIHNINVLVIKSAPFSTAA